ncbi:cytochrome c oxidase assembly factor 6 homolog [Tribolium madens]|uniref:cytochrome c oxidase assembly factor 6 homolog n=1 Tax=Tribolium madens TaxID=41895 RepID=UPI001CF73577|nr:cytochrome c oxidase assembly factor 6 homolog [Tribolium madens]
MSFPTKEDRNLCWSARDRYWECLNKNGIIDSKDDRGPCLEFRKLYEKSCSAQWVKHFDRRRNYLQFKEKIEKHGYEPLDERSQEH